MFVVVAAKGTIRIGLGSEFHVVLWCYTIIVDWHGKLTCLLFDWRYGSFDILAIVHFLCSTILWFLRFGLEYLLILFYLLETRRV